MKILDLKKVTIILVTMLLFLNMQISVFASDNCTVVKIPVRQIFDSEVEGIADEFSYIMTTDQSGAPMPAGGRNMQYSWTMKKNAATEITLNVKTAGQYHYTLCQTTEKKDNYKYDQNKYHVTVEAYYNESNQLKVVTISPFHFQSGQSQPPSGNVTYRQSSSTMSSAEKPSMPL